MISAPQRRQWVRLRARPALDALGLGAAAAVCLLAILGLQRGVDALLVRPPRLAGQRQASFGHATVGRHQRAQPLSPPLMMAAAAGGSTEGESGKSGKASSAPQQGSGRGFGDAVRRGSGSGSGSNENAPEANGKSGRPRRGRPNSFSSLGQAVRHRGKFGHGAPFELGLLDMSTKLMERHEAIKERYAGARPVQAGGGRQRGAKKAAAFHALSSYSLHFLKCVLGWVGLGLGCIGLACSSANMHLTTNFSTQTGCWRRSCSTRRRR